MTDNERIIHFTAPAGSTPEQIQKAGERAAFKEMENDVNDMLKGVFGKPDSKGNWTFDL